MKYLIEQEQHFIASTSTYSTRPGEHQLKVLYEGYENIGTTTFRFRKWFPRRGANGEYALQASSFHIHNQCAMKGVIVSLGDPGFAICEADWRKNAELEDTRCKDMRKVLLQMEFRLNCDTMGVVLQFAGLEHFLRGWLHAFDEVSK